MLLVLLVCFCYVYQAHSSLLIPHCSFLTAHSSLLIPYCSCPLCSINYKLGCALLSLFILIIPPVYVYGLSISASSLQSPRCRALPHSGRRQEENCQKPILALCFLASHLSILHTGFPERPVGLDGYQSPGCTA
jgi:hypothetical protein